VFRAIGRRKNVLLLLCAIGGNHFSGSENGKADWPSRLLAREAKVADATAGV
jgi:hypothetical protein